MDDVVGYLRDLTAHFFSGSQVQLDTFTGAALKKAGDSRVRLQSCFFLSERARAGYGSDDHYNKK